MGVPLRILMAATIAIVAAITAVVCFAPTYIAGVNSVVSTVESLRVGVSTLASARIATYFNKPRDLALLMQYANQRGRLDVSNSTAMTQLTCDIAFGNVGSFTAAMIVVFDTQLYVRCDLTIASNPTLTMLPPGGGAMNGYVVDNATRLPIPGSLFFSAPLPTDVPLWAFATTTTVMQFNPNIRTVWGSPDLAWNSTKFEVASRFDFPNGTFRGAIMFDLNTPSIETFLKTLGLREHGRAVTWDDNTGTTVALSWDEPSVILLPNWQNQLLPTSQRAIFRQLDNFTDPLLQRVLAAYGGLAALRVLQLPFSSSFDAGKNLVYVDIIGVSDAYGLNMKTLIMMPQIDFLKDVYQQQLQTIVGVCCGVAAMIAIAFVIGHLMASPLQRLAERMQLCASFEDNEEDDPPSALSEVASMQKSYCLMKTQLNRAKTYLPQSVLAVQEDDEDDGESTQAATDVNAKSLISSGSPTDMAASRIRTDAARTDTGTSRSSRRKTMSSNSGVAVVGLNLEMGLSHRCVSVVAFNLTKFMQNAVSSGRRCAEVQEAMLTAVQKAVRDNKGVVDYFQGDRVLASFNAVTNTAAHGRRAISAALAAVRDVKSNAQVPAHATAGVSCGMALCGNMGTTDMRRFCIVGYPVTQALTLERLTKMYPGVSVLLPGWMENDASLDLYYQAIDLVRLPGGGSKLDASENKQRCLLLAPLSQKNVAAEEWMYELRSGEESDPFHHVNSGFKALLAGDFAGAQAALAARKSDSAADALGATNLAAHIARVEDTTLQPTDFGPFYSTAVLGN